MVLGSVEQRTDLALGYVVAVARHDSENATRLEKRSVLRDSETRRVHPKFEFAGGSVVVEEIHSGQSKPRCFLS